MSASLTIVLTIALGAFTVSIPAVLLVTGGGESAEWSLYLGAFALVLPLSAVGGIALARALDRRGTLTVTALAWSSSLLALLVLARLHYVLDKSASLGSAVSVAAMLSWLAAAGAVGWLALRRPGHPTVARIEALGVTRLFVLPGVLLAALLLGFSRGFGLGLGHLALALVIGAGALGAHLILLRGHAPRWLGIALDLCVVVLLALLLNDLALHEEPQRFFRSTSDIHQNFFLGPLNDLLHGRPLLVETFSQYGVGIFYFLAGWFQLATPGYGGLTLISGLLTAAMVALAYCVLRLGSVPRPLAVTATSGVVLAAYFNSLAPPSSLPSEGGLRFLLPYLLVALALLSERRSERTRVVGVAVPAVIAIASLWSLETFVYCLAAFAGTAATSAASGAGGLRVFARRLGRELAAAAVAILLAQLLFATLTRALAAQWPNWGWYLDFIGTYSVDGFGALPIAPWSPGVLLGAVYLAALAGVAVLRVQAPRIFSEERIALMGIAGFAVFGFASLSYFVGLSSLTRVALLGPPCLLATALWLGILERQRTYVPLPARIGALSAAFGAAGMLAVFSWPMIKERAPDTPLAIGLFGAANGDSIGGSLGRMWRSEPLNDRVAGARRLVRRHFPGNGPMLVVAEAGHTVDILVQTGRANALPVSDFLQDGILIGRSWPRVARTVDELPAGTLMLTERKTLDPRPRAKTALGLILRQAEVLLRRTTERIRDRFRLEVVDRASGGFLVVRLEPRP